MFGRYVREEFFLPSYIMYIGWLEYKCLFEPFIPIDILLFLTHRGLKEPICLTILNTEAWFGRRFGLRVVGRQSTDCRRLIKTTLDLDTRSGDIDRLQNFHVAKANRFYKISMWLQGIEWFFMSADCFFSQQKTKIINRSSYKSVTEPY